MEALTDPRGGAATTWWENYSEARADPANTGWEAGIHATAETAGSPVGGFLGGAASS